jgi:hypothetical protein
MKKKIYLTFLVMLLLMKATFAQAATSSSTSKTDLTLSLGNLCEYVGQIQTDDSGETNVCSFEPYLATALDFEISDSFFLSPELAFSIPQSGTDENIKRMTIVTLINSKYKTSYVNLIGGLGFFFTRIWGPGGEAELNNGNDVDSFPLPDDPVYTRNFIINVGIQTEFNQQWSAELRSYIFNLTTSEDRAFSVGLQGTYHFGGVL